jgi:tRNA-specific adenosine deaminase 3
MVLSIGPFSPTVPDELELPPPYAVTVPIASAETETSLLLKNQLWPTIYTPRRKGEMEPWSRAKLKWAYSAVQFMLSEARKVQQDGEVLASAASIN